MHTNWMCLVGVAAALAGCRVYEAKPLDLAAHTRAWSERTAGSPEVAAFLARLDAAADETGSDRHPPPLDLTDGLSRDEAEIVALVFNPDLRVARLRANVAAASAAHAGLWDDPRLEVDVLRILSSVDDRWISGVGLGFTLPTSGRLEVEKARADATLATELERIHEAEWAVRHDVRDAWTAWTAARLRLEETERLVAALASIVESTNRLAEVGEMPRTEATLLAIERMAQRTEVGWQRGAVSVAEQRLRDLLGLSPAAPLDPRPAIDVALAHETYESALSALIPNHQTRGNLTLARLDAEYEVAEQTLHREIRKQHPDITIGPQYENDEGQSRIGLGLGLPLPFLNANRRGIAEAEAAREVARAVYETTYEQQAGRLNAAFIERANAQAQLGAIERDLVPLVDRQIADANRLLALGEGSGLVLLESLTRAHATKLRVIELRASEARAGSAIIQLVGPEIRTDARTDIPPTEEVVP